MRRLSCAACRYWLWDNSRTSRQRGDRCDGACSANLASHIWKHDITTPNSDHLRTSWLLALSDLEPSDPGPQHDVRRHFRHVMRASSLLCSRATVFDRLQQADGLSERITTHTAATVQCYSIWAWVWGLAWPYLHIYDSAHLQSGSLGLLTKCLASE